MKLWRTLAPCCRAGFFSSWYPQLNIARSQQAPTPPTFPIPTADIEIPEKLHEWYEPIPTAFINVQRIPVKFFKKHLHHSWIREFLIGQRGEEEHAVVSWGMFLFLLPEERRNWFVSHGWHAHPVTALHKAIKDYTVRVRLAGRADASDDGTLAALMRKVASPLGRSLSGADTEQEAARAHPAYSRRTGIWSRQEYLRRIAAALGRLATEVIESLYAAGGTNTLDMYWKKRSTLVPGGSSNLRRGMQDTLAGIPGIDRAPRPNKKAVWEHLPAADVQQWLLHEPISVARFSTKPEPGLKQRALYAQDDVSAWYAAFVSEGIERHMNVGGMCPSQRPYDVAQWHAADKGQPASGNPIWMSLDYTNFNKEHSNIELMLCDIAFGKAFLKKAAQVGHQGFLEKGLLSLMLARSRHRSYVRGDESVSGYSMSGLWSGHRNTARDNTMLHAAYQQIVLSALRDMQIIRPIRTFMCGDDEDTLLDSLLDAQLYAWGHMMLGWHLNPAKQMIGTVRHEFLQWLAAGRSISKPLASMVATLVMGNWYKSKVLEVASLPAAAADQAIALAARGADHTAVSKAMEAVLGNAFRHVNVRAARPLAIAIPPRSGKSTLIMRYGLIDVDRTRSWEDVAAAERAAARGDLQLVKKLHCQAASTADPTIPMLVWGPSTVPHGYTTRAVVLAADEYQRQLDRSAPQGRHQHLWNRYHECANVPGCVTVSTQDELDAAVVHILEEEGAVFERGYYDWRVVLGTEHPAVVGLPAVILPVMAPNPGITTVPRSATDDYVELQRIWEPSAFDQQLIARQRLSQNYSSVMREHRNNENRAMMALLPRLPEPPPFLWKKQWPKVSAVLGVELLGSLLEETFSHQSREMC